MFGQFIAVLFLARDLAHRDHIAEEVEAIEAIIDELVEFYLSNIFKLKRLK